MHCPDTEIDWVAYMQEVQGWEEVRGAGGARHLPLLARLAARGGQGRPPTTPSPLPAPSPGLTTRAQGELDYTKLRGDTGPLVYPAGFVYLFAALRRATGGAVPAAQPIFALAYLATQAAALALYVRARTLPPWALPLLCLSRRLHSIYLLRLFNDGWAMLVAYLATLALQVRHMTACWSLPLARRACGRACAWAGWRRLLAHWPPPGHACTAARSRARGPPLSPYTAWRCPSR